VVLGLVGAVLGGAFGVGGFLMLVEAMAPLKASGATIVFDPLMAYLFIMIILGAALSALIPAIRMMNMDVAKAIAKAV
jgi:ABC-type antimicrobial peptide transport system permease subunit